MPVISSEDVKKDTTYKEHGKKFNLKIQIIIVVVGVFFITVFDGVLFVHQPGANHAPRTSVTQVNHSVHTLSTFLRIRADPSMQIF